jgi:cysteine desulfurase family protein
MVEVIYMDNAATSYPKPETVYEAVDSFNRHMGGNPGRGSNRSTLQAGSVIQQTREALADLFNIKDSLRIAFAHNVTDAINIGLKGILRPGDHVITTSMEHNAVARPLYFLSQQGVEWTTVPCDSEGKLDPEDMRKAIKSNTRMICMLHASNLTGTIMPIEEVGRLAHQEDVLFMVDCAQTAGVLPIDVEQCNIDLLAFTGHKSLYGLQGTGGLYVRPGLTVNPLKHGGTGSFSEHLQHPILMPDSLESGTLNTPGLAGLLAGIQYIKATGLANILQREQVLLERLVEGLSSIKGVSIYGPTDLKQRTAVLAMNIEGMDCGELSVSLDYEYGIVNRSGLHCAPLAHQTIGTFESGTCRFSPGFFTTEADIDTVIRAVHELASRQ